MPRIPRGQSTGVSLHVLNRSNDRSAIFRSSADYTVFIDLLRRTKEAIPLPIYAFAVMPNHFHILLQATESLSAFMQKWTTAHVRNHHVRHGGSGHIWQGRFKSFPVQTDEHFLTVARYVLRNPVRAGLALHPGDWPWSSLRHRHLIDSWPLPLPPNWHEWLETPCSQGELVTLRRSVRRRTPFGAPGWQQEVTAGTGYFSGAKTEAAMRHNPEKLPVPSPRWGTGNFCGRIRSAAEMTQGKSSLSPGATALVPTRPCPSPTTARSCERRLGVGASAGR